MTNSTFSSNFAISYAAGLTLYDTARGWLRGARFVRNRAQEAGAGMRLQTRCTAFLDDVFMADNAVPGEDVGVGAGAAIYTVDDSHLTANNLRITRTRAGIGAVYFAGGCATPLPLYPFSSNFLAAARTS